MSTKTVSLKDYKRKRHFATTPEPSAKSSAKSANKLHFVVQKHTASHLHYDFRLELDGVLKSWAVPKGPSLNPEDRRLAIATEDHPLDYGKFEGVIPEGNYGAGKVEIWDKGSYAARQGKTVQHQHQALLKGLAEGHLTFVLQGQKLKGEFALIRLRRDEDDKTWLLIKKDDKYSK